MLKSEVKSSRDIILVVIFSLVILGCNKKILSGSNNKSPFYLEGMATVVDLSMSRMLQGGKYYYFIEKDNKLTYKGNGSETWKYEEKLQPKERKVSFNFETGWQVDNQPIQVDSLVIAKYLLKNTTVGGETYWTYPQLDVITEGNNIILYGQRKDLVLYYYLYYGLYGAEQIPNKVVGINIANQEKETSCTGLDTLIKGNPIESYSKLPESYCNKQLLYMYLCYDKWLQEVAHLGWETAKKRKISPFDNCNCRIGFSIKE